MDIEKLIEQLNDFNENHISVLCGSGQCACGYLCDKDDCIVVRAATALSTLQAENEKLRAELEQVKQERDAAVESIPHECKTCVYHTVFFNGCTPDYDCTNHDGGCSNNYDRWEWRGQKED